MKTGIVFYLTDHQMMVYQVTKTELIELQRFSATEEGPDRLKKWLLGSPIQPLLTPVSLLVDVSQEEYDLGSVPKVRSHHQKTLLQNRLRRKYPNLPYTFAKIQKQAKKTGRLKHSSDEQILLTALQKPEQVSPWVKCLLKRQIAIQGIYSAPLLGELLLKSIKSCHYCLVIGHIEQPFSTSGDALRQSFFQNGELVSSRLTALNIPPDADSIHEQYASHIASQVQLTLNFLRGKSLLPVEQTLNVVLFSDQKHLQAMQSYLNQHTQTKIHYQLWDIQSFMRAQGLKKLLPYHHLSLLNACQIIWQPQVSHYGQAGDSFFFRHLRMRRGLQLAGIGIFLVAIVITAFSIYNTWSLKQQSLITEQKTVALTQDFQIMRDRQKVFLDTHYDPRHIKNAVEVAEALRKRNSTPVSSLQWLGMQLKDFPTLKLINIQWKVEDILNPLMKKGSNISNFEKKLLANRMKKGLIKVKQKQTLQLNGEIFPFNGDRGLAHRQVLSFITRLRENSDVQVIEHNMPLNIRDPDKTLRESFGKNNIANYGKAVFELELIISLE
ncbi:hypothetical protein QUF61_04390 [Candidatus Venteria ishoeyi]|uniref:hypothetical protein n=1 Tax=Candidatus Venteria ishoeyi TaxID=1899563 RepID=UPI0025A58AD6|nr:hypothetical protein [Candidatus Venteria ishoeyi]MDM8545714.1 hypothetical protein [Candidatus Venteria ishoeyi]